jgi:hypothetical protein
LIPHSWHRRFTFRAAKSSGKPNARCGDCAVPYENLIRLDPYRWVILGQVLAIGPNAPIGPTGGIISLFVRWRIGVSPGEGLRQRRLDWRHSRALCRPSRLVGSCRRLRDRPPRSEPPEKIKAAAAELATGHGSLSVKHRLTHKRARLAYPAFDRAASYSRGVIRTKGSFLAPSTWASGFRTCGEDQKAAVYLFADARKHQGRSASHGARSRCSAGRV